MSDTKNNIDWKTYSGTKLCINVNNSQVEIDGGYEGLETLSLIEAKNSLLQSVGKDMEQYIYGRWSS